MKVVNLQRVKLNLDLKKREVVLDVKAEIEGTGRQIEYRAKQDAPVDLGTLRQSIFYERTKNGFGAMVTANADHAPYIEFGTGGAVDIPAGFEEMAAQFKGKGIRQVNLPARPFLIPNAKNETRKMVERLKRKYGTK